jgi:L-threonylcarbamoyladenylate synthase
MRGRIFKDEAQILSNGGVGVLPTDTIYGIVGSALNPRTVARIYKLRRRNLKKPMIILIGSLGDLRLFGITPDRATLKILKKFWPGNVSIILPCKIKRFLYLHRGTKALAFRLPKPIWLCQLLQKTGPLVAPSANWEGKLPARTIGEAKKYFGKEVDFYVDAGLMNSTPSMLIKIEKGKVIVLRK